MSLGMPKDEYNKLTPQLIIVISRPSFSYMEIDGSVNARENASNMPPQRVSNAASVQINDKISTETISPPNNSKVC